MESLKVATTCKGCQRSVYASDLDRDGYCCLCSKPASKAETKTAAPKPEIKVGGTD